MSSRASRPRSRRRLVGVSAVAVGALLTTYTGSLRTSSYARAVEPAAATCSAGATLVADDTQLQTAIISSVDDSVICITADITVSQTLVIDDTTVTFEGQGDVSLSGASARRIIYADFTTGSGEDDTLTIRNLTLTGGRESSTDGGAVRVAGDGSSDALVITDATISESYAVSDGGGVSVEDLATVSLTRATFTDDSVGTSGDAGGGALEIVRVGSTNITDTTFTDSYSAEWGGALFLNDSGVTRITGSTFERNSSGAQAGGAIEVDIDDSTLPGALYITDTVFRSNSSALGNGGAVRITDADDTVSLTRVNFYSNSADTGDGGALSISSQTGPTFLTNVTAWDNYAQDSGGFMRLWGSTAPITVAGLDSRRNESISSGGSMRLNGPYQYVNGSTFTDDSAGDNGGGIRSANALELRITGSTFKGNYARLDGGAIMTTDDSDITISGTSFVSNTAADDGGAVEINDAREVYVSTSTFQLNTAVGDDGGALLINGADDTVSLATSNFYQNIAGGEGGAIKTLNHTGVFLATSVTMSDNTAASKGGAMYIAPDEAFISNSTFADNTATGANSDGGGIYIRNAFTHVVDTVEFARNTSGGLGGAIRIFSNNGVDDSTSITGVTFTDDSSVASGGALSIRNEGALTLSSITGTGTSAGGDGGFAQIVGDDSSVAASQILLDDLTITSTRALGTGVGQGDGGAFFITDVNTLIVRDSLISGATAADDGGALMAISLSRVYVDNTTMRDGSAADYVAGLNLLDVDDTISVSNSTFSGLTADQVGSAVYLTAGPGGVTEVINTTVTGSTQTRSSAGDSGALALDGGPGSTARLDFVTIAGNTGPSGGGVWTGADIAATAANSIIAGNSSSSGSGDVYVSGSSSFAADYSLFTSASSVIGTTIAGTGNLFGAPKLNGLADNGGPTSTMLPQWDSPAFQAGDPNWVAPPVNDQRGAGFPRDAGGWVSMGAIQGRSAKPVDPVFPPSAPREVTAVAGDAQAVVSWKAPASTGSFPVTTYQVDDSTGEFSQLVTVQQGEPLSAVFDDLVNEQEYAFRVRALNGAGFGPWSELSDPVVPQPGPSILITGTRDRRYARVTGVSTGLVGESLTPRVKLPGQTSYRDGVARPEIDSEGEFDWQRKTRKKVYVYFVTEDLQVRSNRVIIRPRS